MNENSSTARTFEAGDSIVLAEGTYQGTMGVFLHYSTGDSNWADIQERNGSVRSHPIVWMRHIEPSA